jgi:hypothetical protein
MWVRTADKYQWASKLGILCIPFHLCAVDLWLRIGPTIKGKMKKAI